MANERKKGRAPRLSSSTPRRTTGLEVYPMDDGCLIHRPGVRKLHRLNASAALVLKLCDGRHSVEEIIDLVQRAFTLSRAPRRDVETVLAQMAAEGLVSGGRKRPQTRRSK